MPRLVGRLSGTATTSVPARDHLQSEVQSKQGSKPWLAKITAISKKSQSENWPETQPSAMPRSGHPQGRDDHSTKTQYSSRSSTNGDKARKPNSEASNAFERNLTRVGESSMVERYRTEKNGPISDRLVHITGNWQKRQS